MIDHILLFPDQAAADVAFPQPVDAETGLPVLMPSWGYQSGTVMPVKMIVARATYDTQGNELTPTVTVPGVWYVVRTKEVNEALMVMSECLVVTDSELVKVGAPYVVMTRLQPTTPLAQVEPIFSGDAYPFPPGVTGQYLRDQLIA